jgi:hypothetical protein
MYSFHADSAKSQLLGKTEYGETVAIELVPKNKPGTYELTLTLEGREPQSHTFLAKDTDFLGNKVQLKGPFLRIVLDPETAEKFRAFLRSHP